MPNKTVFIQMGNGGGVAGVWEHYPSDYERAVAYAAHLRVRNTPRFLASVQWNTSILEVPILSRIEPATTQGEE